MFLQCISALCFKLNTTFCKFMCFIMFLFNNLENFKIVSYFNQAQLTFPQSITLTFLHFRHLHTTKPQYINLHEHTHKIYHTHTYTVIHPRHFLTQKYMLASFNNTYYISLLIFTVIKLIEQHFSIPILSMLCVLVRQTRLIIAPRLHLYLLHYD